MLRRVPPYEGCGGATGFNSWGLHPQEKYLKRPPVEKAQWKIDSGFVDERAQYPLL
jgi:hypothetical protein